MTGETDPTNKSRFDVSLELTGERFKVVYSLWGSEPEVRGKGEDICVEQTIEFPADLVTGGDIRKHIVGRIERLEQVEASRWQAEISFALETVGTELTQLLNVVFGNFSLKPDVRVERLVLPPSLLKEFKGPGFGIQGIRQLVGVENRPLLCTALKPMGLPVDALAQLAYTFAMGGVDMIKDDHGLADQPFAPYNERVQRCSEAVRKANRQTGGNCLYIPNLSAPSHQIIEKALWAKECGAGGLMVAPGLTGFDTMRMVARHGGVGMPIISHPAFVGTYVVSPRNGISHYALFGQLMRLAGADATIYPNYGGRFTFSMDDCKKIVDAAQTPMGHIKPIFSAPGGGMDLKRIPGMIDIYGKDVIFLIGGALHKLGPDLIENCRAYMDCLKGL